MPGRRRPPSVGTVTSGGDGRRPASRRITYAAGRWLSAARAPQASTAAM
ncbi:MAG: hypothetical protein QOI73_956 [Solirubrobacteraceae bacterium]|nr:hypothetical protein [Solirubrobacteraceae bacterium]